jgi:phage terminase small subunit
MATIKQKRAIKALVGNGGNVTAAMREAGYSENTINTPQKLTTSVGFLSIADQIPDELLVKKHLELLNVPIKKRVYIKGDLQAETEELDSQAIGKGLEMAYKLKGSFAAEKQTIRFEDVPEEEKQAISKAFNNL